ncbi:hypothetical protein HK105_203918 [Polyrhizophydium stewartii]|uniref:AB hydrolase-1 domain-containing protein n=1 Tax=Polyrhizophydium stewartii TaxID=2732419 RepID=A0ABR4NAE6_9FUNG|nr:hypothetical protein HK105_004371 [Polyrhizophydium stewartii]
MRELAAQVQHAARTHAVVALDYAGHGASAAPAAAGDYATDAIVGAAARAIDALAPASATSFVLVGHSYGCTIAARLARAWAGRGSVAGVALLAPKTALAPHERLGLAALRAAVPAALLDAGAWLDARLGPASVAAASVLSRAASPWLRAEQTRMAAAMSGAAKRSALLAAEFAGEREFRDFPAPLLLIGGTLDTVAPPDPNITAIERWTRVPATRSHLLIAGHQLMLEQPARVNALLDAFIASLP